MRGAGVLATVVAACLWAAAPALGSHDADVHSDNVRPLASLGIGGLGDMAFWGNLAVVSQFTFDEGTNHGFSVLDVGDPRAPRELKRFVCTGGGWDVSMWEDLVFVSVDNFSPTEDGGCDSPSGDGFMGIKIVSVADPARPVGIGSVPLSCSGSHTNTLVPDLANRRLLIYASSLRYSNDGPEPGCDAIIEVPLDDPGRAKVVGSLSGDTVAACHDVAAFLPRRLLVGACQSELRLYDISDPAAPALLSSLTNPTVAFQHSGAFSNDGNTLVMGEENLFYTGGTGACLGGTRQPAQGALWFYDITNPAVPVPRGYHQLSRGLEARSPGGTGCSAHNFNTIPTHGDQDVLVTAWYAGGMSAIDFSDPGAPREIAYYQPALREPARRSHYWSAYWYRGVVYASNTSETERKSLDVYEITDRAIGPAYRLTHLNPQTQEALAEAPPEGAPPAPAPGGPAGAGAGPGGEAPNRAAPCRATGRRIRIAGARRVLRAGLYDGPRRVRRLKSRGAIVRVNVRGLRAGRYLARVTYRDRKGRRRVAGRRVTVC